MKLNSFLITLFWKQNKYHKHSVLVHTLRVVYNLIKYKQYDMIIAGLLHDIGKPVVAFQDEDDIVENKGSYSFTGHEEKSYEIIKNWFWVNEETKVLVRYHYLITGMASDMYKFTKTHNPKYLNSYAQRLVIWDSLSPTLQTKLMYFKKSDDLGKGYPNIRKAIPKFLEETYNKTVEG